MLFSIEYMAFLLMKNGNDWVFDGFDGFDMRFSCFCCLTKIICPFFTIFAIHYGKYNK